MYTIRIHEVIFPPDIEEKLWWKHGELAQVDVDEAIDNPIEDPRWDVDPLHGSRVLIVGDTTNFGTVFVALDPVDPERGVWSVRTAFPVDDGFLREKEGDK